MLRTRLRFEISIIDVSITLNKETLANVKKQCNFAQNVKIFKISLDRSKIFLQFSLMRHIEKHIKDLQHMLPVQVQRPQDISKMVVYVNKIRDVNRTCERIRR